MLLLLPIAFGAGLVTALTPCILPVLPIVLAGGGSGGRRRPLAIVAGLVTTFTAFTLAATAILSALDLGPNVLTDIAVATLLLLAATLVVPRLGELLERPFAALTRRRTGELGGGFLLGASLGLVFVPCAGPVFATVSSVVALHRIGAGTVAVTLAYALGAALPMLLVAHGGRHVAERIRGRVPALRVALGAVMAVGAVAIQQGWETSLQTRVPSYATSLQNWIEGSAVATRGLDRLRHAPVRGATASGLRDYGPAPGFIGISSWLNTAGGEPLTLPALRGKVVLLDFWTYSCINCLRTLPHLEAWDARYRKAGLEIVGIHTPEFAFEHDLGNVRAAVARLGIHYPVGLDGAYDTWNVWGNQYWPAEYLIDARGHVRAAHFGEGDYAGTESEIRSLLAERRTSLPPAVNLADATPTGLVTPETYLGYTRLDRYAGTTVRHDRFERYRAPRSLPQNDVAFAGSWNVGPQRAVAGPGARIVLHFVARDVYVVLTGKGRVRVSIDGKPQRSFAATAPRLYTAVSGPKIREGVLELALSPGLQAYSFTFG